MDDLIALLEDEFYESDTWIQVEDADWSASDLKLSLSINTYDEAPAQLWEVHCKGVVEEQISSTYAESLYLSSGSPRLLPFLEEHYDLMFSKNQTNPAELLGIITSCCVEVFGDAKYLHRFLNQSPRICNIVSSKYGNLGRFPNTLAQLLMRKLESHPISINALPTGLPKKWIWKEVIYYPQLQVLDIGECYVIAEDFFAKRA